MPKPALPIAAVIAAAGLAAVALFWCLSGAPDLADRLRDDAFYEFVWAANVAAGRGPMVSDGVTTSGVQLLWSLLLVPFAWLWGAGALPVLAPWLGLALHVCGAATWLRIVREPRAAWVLALCWLAQPLLLRECQNGQETALACLCALQLWLARSSGWPRFLLCASLAVFARSDLFGMVLLLAWGRGGRQRLLPLAVLAAFVLVNLTLGGGPWPDSALPMPWLWHANFAVTDPSASAVMQRHWWFARPVLLGGPWQVVGSLGVAWCAFRLLRLHWPRPLRALPLVLVGVAAWLGTRDLLVPTLVAALLLALPRSARRGARRDRELLLLTLALGAIVAVHWAVRWYPRDYYLAPVVLLPFVAVARSQRWPGLLLAFVAAQALQTLAFTGEALQGQRELQLAGQQLAAVLPGRERVGCFNSGIVTFLQDVLAQPQSRRGIVNLDGVVDHRSFAALQRRGLAAWLDAQGVRYVLDHAVQFATDAALPHASGHWFAPDFDPARDLVEIARFDVLGVHGGRPGTDGLRLYWRRAGGAVPPPVTATARWLGGDGVGGAIILVPLAAGAVLEVEVADGERRPVATVAVATQLVMLLPVERRGTGRLFVAGEADPVLELPPL